MMIILVACAQMSLLSSFVGSAARVVVQFADAERRQTVTVRQPDGRDQEQYLFSAGDNVCGTVSYSLHIHYPRFFSRVLHG